MKEQPQNDHLAPEEFVDLLDGAPVEASRRQHLETCRPCSDELGKLRQTLALVELDKVAPTPSPRRSRAASTWAAAAAAVLVAAFAWYWAVIDRGAPLTPEETVEELLPPVEEDEDFQLLLALSDASGTDLSEIADETLESTPFDTEGWTSDERRRFVERLAEEMRSSS